MFDLKCILFITYENVCELMNDRKDIYFHYYYDKRYHDAKSITCWINYQNKYVPLF